LKPLLLWRREPGKLHLRRRVVLGTGVGKGQWVAVARSALLVVILVALDSPLHPETLQVGYVETLEATNFKLQMESFTSLRICFGTLSLTRYLALFCAAAASIP
jgi:hypothetical protein